MNTREVLIAARKLITNPNNWCQERAFKLWKMCAVGAIHVAEHNTYTLVWGNNTESAANILSNLSNKVNNQKLNNCTISGYNDTHTHQEVLALFDKAIASLDKEEIPFSVSIMEKVKNMPPLIEHIKTGVTT